MFTYLGQAIAAIGKNRKRPPRLWLMTTSRFAWLGSSEDQQQRPLMITDADGSGNFNLLAVKATQDDALPTGLSGNPGSFTTGGTQDVIIACRPEDMLVWESAPSLNVFTENLSGSLEARIQYRCHVGAVRTLSERDLDRRRDGPRGPGGFLMSRPVTQRRATCLPSPSSSRPTAYPDLASPIAGRGFVESRRGPGVTPGSRGSRRSRRRPAGEPR